MIKNGIIPFTSTSVCIFLLDFSLVLYKKRHEWEVYIQNKGEESKAEQKDRGTFILKRLKPKRQWKLSICGFKPCQDSRCDYQCKSKLVTRSQGEVTSQVPSHHLCLMGSFFRCFWSQEKHSNIREFLSAVHTPYCYQKKRKKLFLTLLEKKQRRQKK